MTRFPPILHIGISALFLTSAASMASAQPGSAPGAEVGPEAKVSSGVDEGIENDPNMDSAWLAPTGLTMPKGKWAFHDQELFLVGLSYGVTDRLQLSATTLVPITSDQGLLLITSAKGQVVKQGRVRLAVHGALTHVSDDGSSGNAVTVGGAFSYCLDKPCNSAINLYAGTGFALDDGDSELPLLMSASVIKKLGKRVKFVGEVDTGMIVGGDRADAYLGWYGLRFHNKNMAADIGFVKPFGSDLGDTDVFPIGLPWVKFTYRGG